MFSEQNDHILLLLEHFTDRTVIILKIETLFNKKTIFDYFFLDVWLCE